MTKTCWLDGDHYATVTIHLNGTSTYGYSVFYGRTGGWTYGNQSNEDVYKTEFLHWTSPDSGNPGVWINRDAMPDIPRTVVWIIVQAIGDKPSAADPRCDIRFDKGPDY